MAEDPKPPFDEAHQGKPFDTSEDKSSEAGQRAEDLPGNYFESMTVRLNSAIAAKLAGLRPAADKAPPVQTVAQQDATEEVPTLDRILRAADESVPPEPPPQGSPVAKAFAALLALEEGQPGARPVRLVTSDGEPRITNELVEELTRRVIDRLGSSTTRELVAQVVSQVAERLVVAEIERIRKKHV